MNELNIITQRPVEYSNACGCGGYSSLDGKSTAEQITAFQQWGAKFNMKDDQGNDLVVVDGKWGPKTASLYKKFGKKYEAAISKKKVKEKPVVTSEVKENSSTVSSPVMDKESGEEWKRKKAGYIKLGAITLGSLAAIGIIYWIVKK